MWLYPSFTECHIGSRHLSHLANIRRKGNRKNPKSLGKICYQVPGEEYKNLDNIVSSHLFEMPGGISRHFLRRENYSLSLLPLRKKYSSLKFFVRVWVAFRRNAFYICMCSMTLKVSRAREELSNWSRQAVVPFYFSDLADTVMIKLPVAN